MRRGRFKQTGSLDVAEEADLAPHARLSVARFLAGDSPRDDERSPRVRLAALKLRVSILTRLACGRARDRGPSRMTVLAATTQAVPAARERSARIVLPVSRSRTRPTSAETGRTCGARCKQTGSPCVRRPSRDRRTGRVRNGRCHLHGGLSTGPRTPEGRARARAAVLARWRRYRATSCGGAPGC
jgi:hypothetical protein